MATGEAEAIPALGPISLLCTQIRLQRSPTSADGIGSARSATPMIRSKPGALEQLRADRTALSVGSALSF
jgi:hypothetical protein